ncbi:hypothetical protein BpHYR1_034418 [Brachionus plicatilis]|uniref:Uncharacterized protein n=1 Tax=Brachionus plicatilis TaxID=10195 RepID=A0A3M7TAZ2_BRAPC|nr:hypothetical protein BpHYR1_034418 [Brachionus plicatilis]
MFEIGLHYIQRILNYVPERIKFDENLCFNSQIDFIRALCLDRLNILKILSNALPNIYKTLIGSVIDYKLTKDYACAFVNSSRICNNKTPLCGIWNELNESMIENGFSIQTQSNNCGRSSITQSHINFKINFKKKKEKNLFIVTYNILINLYKIIFCAEISNSLSLDSSSDSCITFSCNLLDIVKIINFQINIKIVIEKVLLKFCEANKKIKINDYSLEKKSKKSNLN